MYADDTSMRIHTINLKKAEHDVLKTIDKAKVWFLSNDLIINDDKTQLLYLINTSN